ncbi:MAG: hypothetical protein EOP06_16705 [Proteobacteria bacterium]|nr:MAG: hypothetical protein EOP06_16705 [Pseudomonadota bacterium]
MSKASAANILLVYALSILLFGCVTQPVTESFDPCDSNQMSEELRNDCRLRNQQKSQEAGVETSLQLRTCDESIGSANFGRAGQELTKTNCYSHYQTRLTLSLHCPTMPAAYGSGYDPSIPFKFQKVDWQIHEHRGIATTDAEGKLRIVYTGQEEPSQAQRSEVPRKILLKVRGHSFELNAPSGKAFPALLPIHICDN